MMTPFFPLIRFPYPTLPVHFPQLLVLNPTPTTSPLLSTSDTSAIPLQIDNIFSSSSLHEVSLAIDLSQPIVLPSLLIRKSTRLTKSPSHLKDFVCHTAHWCNLVRFDSLPPIHQSLLASQSQWHEPKTYKKAAQDPLWVQAITSELQPLQDNHTWDHVPLPFGKKTVGYKWVYKIKLKADGSIERYKARHGLFPRVRVKNMALIFMIPSLL